jgi:hypothetical protein
MRRTFFLKDHIDKIDMLNDQLWYYLLATEELNNKLLNFSALAKENYVEDLFNNNIYRKRIHVKVSSLPDHQKENKNLTFGAYFATCYEIGSKYIRRAFDVLIDFNRLTNYSWDSGKGPEKNLELLFARSGLTTPNNNHIETLTYLRLRRNHYTHINENIAPTLQGIITSSATRLNSFWHRPQNAVNVDFSRTLIRNFLQDETMQLIKVLRICIVEIDKHVASLLDRSKVIEHIVKREYEKKKSRMNTIVLAERVSEIKNICHREMGFTCTAAQIEPYARLIGAR